MGATPAGAIRRCVPRSNLPLLPPAVVDAKHILLHLDEEKPDDVINESIQQARGRRRGWWVGGREGFMHPGCVRVCCGGLAAWAAYGPLQGGPEGAEPARACPPQVAFADRVLLNKIDLVTEEEKREVVRRIKVRAGPAAALHLPGGPGRHVREDAALPRAAAQRPAPRLLLQRPNHTPSCRPPHPSPTHTHTCRHAAPAYLCPQAINRTTEVIECQQARVELDRILGLQSFDLEQILAMDPAFLKVWGWGGGGGGVWCMWVGAGGQRSVPCACRLQPEALARCACWCRWRRSTTTTMTTTTSMTTARSAQRETT